MTTDQREATPIFVVARRSDAPARRDPVTAGAVHYHRGILVLSAGVLLAALLLAVTREGHVKLPLVGIAMPWGCVWRQVTGLDCPGCGLTRCFVAAAHGNFAAALKFHPMGAVLFVAVVAQLPYRGMQLWRLARGKKELKCPLLLAVPWLLGAGFVVQWVLKISGRIPL